MLRAYLILTHWVQARKEEMWELAKAEGARGDTQSDTHYVKNVAGWWPDPAMVQACALRNCVWAYAVCIRPEFSPCQTRFTPHARICHLALPSAVPHCCLDLPVADGRTCLSAEPAGIDPNSHGATSHPRLRASPARLSTVRNTPTAVLTLASCVRSCPPYGHVSLREQMCC